jgi:glycosyltransferase involved in cell wall biosynthesis
MSLVSPNGSAVEWALVTPTLGRPTGGDIALFELANALARRGRDHVQIVHVPFDGARLSDVGELPWFTFDPAVSHTFAARVEPGVVPLGGVVVYTMKLVATARSESSGAAGRALIDVLAQPPGGVLPILLVQGLGVFGRGAEDAGLGIPGPKVCVGSWLAELLVERGVPDADVVHIPNGVDPRVFRVTRPIEDRQPHVAMNFDPHPVKAGLVGIAAIERLHRELAVPATVFGTRAPERAIAHGVRFELSPRRAFIAEEIYNASSIYLQPSQREGFGMCAVEAMACGCALVTTANGGSRDYALEGETALVCGSDAEQMADALGRLVRDDALRTRLATDGSRFVERFRWTASAERLVRLVDDRLAERRPSLPRSRREPQ